MLALAHLVGDDDVPLRDHARRQREPDQLADRNDDVLVLPMIDGVLRRLLLQNAALDDLRSLLEAHRGGVSVYTWRDETSRYPTYPAFPTRNCGTDRARREGASMPRYTCSQSHAARDPHHVAREPADSPIPSKRIQTRTRFL